MQSLVEQWKKRLEQIREEESPNVVEVGQDAVSFKKEAIQAVELYNIVKRSTNGQVNRVVCIGFTLPEAYKWMERRVCQAKEKMDTVIFYDIVAQDNRDALDPYWNPRPFFLGEPI